MERILILLWNLFLWVIVEFGLIEIGEILMPTYDKETIVYYTIPVFVTMFAINFFVKAWSTALIIHEARY